MSSVGGLGSFRASLTFGEPLHPGPKFIRGLLLDRGGQRPRTGVLSESADQLRCPGAPRRTSALRHPHGRHPGRGTARSGSSEASWAPAATSCADSGARTRSSLPPKAPAGACRARKPRRRWTWKTSALQTDGMECRKDIGVVDGPAGAYTDIDEVMESQRDLVEIVETLKRLVCVKG